MRMALFLAFTAALFVSAWINVNHVTGLGVSVIEEALRGRSPENCR